MINKISKIYKKLAFTFVEIMASMLIIGFLFVVTAFSLNRMTVNREMSRFKNGYAAVESTVASLISDSTIYGTYDGFKNTEAAQLYIGEDKKIFTDILGGENGSYKFRDGFKHYLTIIKQGIKCNLYSGTSREGCFMTDSGVIFGIPDTDFESSGVVTIKDSDGDKIKVSPITMYVRYDGKSATNYNHDAFIIGVEYNGRLHFITTIDEESCHEKVRSVQCDLKNFINSTNISRVYEDR